MKLLELNPIEHSGTVKRAIESLTLAAERDGDLEGPALATAQAVRSYKRERAYEISARHCADPIVNCFLNAVARKMAVGASGTVVHLTDDHQRVLKALGEDTGAGAGYVRERIVTAFWDMLSVYGAFNTLGVTEFVGRTNKLAINTAIPVAVWVLTEANPLTEDTAYAGTSLSPKAEVMGTLVTISYQLLQDIEADLAPMMLERITRAMARLFDYACFVADGTSDGANGSQTGIMADASVPVATAAAGSTLVESTNEDDWLDAFGTLPAPVIQLGPEAWMNPSLIIKAMKIKSNGRRIVKTALEADTGGALFSICGFPLHPVAVMSATNDKATKIAALGLPDSYCAGIRKEFAIDQSPHVTWNKLAVGFRAYSRARGIMKDATGFVHVKTPAQ